MSRNFSITTPAESVRTGKDGRGELVFTVANSGPAATRGMARLVPLGNTKAEWLSVSGESEREFAPGAVQQFTAAAAVPSGTAAGRYTFRLDMVSARRTGEEHEEGPTVALEVTPGAEPAKKSMAWVWIVVAVLVLGIGAVVAVMLTRGGNAKPAPPVAQANAVPVKPEPAVEPKPPVTETVAPEPPAPTDPIPVDGVALWLTGDDALTQATRGKLSSWTGRIAGITASTETATAQPTVMPAKANGHAVVRFDGLDDMLATNVDFSPQGMPQATVFAVFSSNTASATPLRKLYGNDDGNFDRGVGLDPRAIETNYGFFTGEGVSKYFTLEPRRYYLTADEYTRTGFSGWVDGRRTVIDTPTRWGETQLMLHIGGTGPTWFEPWQGDIAEMIVYNRSLSNAERKEVEKYLTEKYAIEQ
ncbi:MAG TPA: hypothetical protein VGF69_16150 [Thermoanaerobaculia bacterium]